MEQSKPEEPRDPIPKSENGPSSNQPTIQPGETKSCFTKPAGAKVVDLTQSDGEDSTYVDGSETKQQSIHGNVKMNKTTKRKAAPVDFNNGQEQDASEPETKPAPKKRKPSTPKKDTKGSKAQTKKKPNGATGNKGRAKPKVKSKNQLVIEGRDARRECKNLKSEIQAKNEEIHRLETGMENLQNQYFSTLKKSNAGFMDDSLVRNKLFGLRESCRAWLLKYSIHGRLPNLELLSMKELISSLTSPECTMSKEANFLVSGNWQHGSIIVLNALLAQLICFQIVQQPFFFLQDSQNEHPIGEIKYFFDNLSNLPLSRAHDWISQTLEMLVPSGLEDTKANRIWETTLESRNRYYDYLTNEFINGPAAILLSPQNENDIGERRAILRGIVEEAGELSIQLRKQRVGIRCLYFDSAKVVHSGFQSSSELMEPHDCMCLGEGINTLDGKEITMVIEPAIVAYWTDNDGIEKEKVWAKSVVWVDDWGQAKTGKGPGDDNRGHDSLTIDKVQPDLEKNSVTATIGTPDTCCKGDEKPKDEITTSVGTTEVQSASADSNSDNISNNTPEAVPDPMDIVKDEHNDEPSVLGMGDNGVNGSPSSSLLKPEINQNFAAEQVYAGPEHEIESIGKSSLANLEKFPFTPSREPNPSPGLNEDTKQTVTKDSDDLALKVEDKENTTSESFSGPFEVVITRPGSPGAPACILPSGTKAEIGADRTPTEFPANEGGNAQCTTGLQKSVPENGLVVPDPKKEDLGDPSDFYKMESVSTTGDEGDRVDGQSMTLGAGKDSTIKVEGVDGCAASKDEMPTNAASSVATDRNFKDVEVARAPNTDSPEFMDDKGISSAYT